MEKIIKSKIVMVMSLILAIGIQVYAAMQVITPAMEVMMPEGSMLAIMAVSSIIGLAINIGVSFLIQLLLFNWITKRKAPSKFDFFNLICINTFFASVFSLVLMLLNLSTMTWLTIINPLYFLYLYMVYNFYSETEGYEKKGLLIYLGVTYGIYILLTIPSILMTSFM